MHIYFCGIGGVGIGPLAEIARDAGYHVTGSDMSESHTTAELERSGITVSYDQSGTNLRAIHESDPIDWFVYTSSLPADHLELVLASQLGIKTAKRDELLNHIITDKKLRLIAVAGTHGKTTTTAMLVWTFQQLGIPVSYSVGSTLSFGPAGKFDPNSDYFIYECDEFDRNFLHFSPYVSLITSVDYDHPDTYPTQAEYSDAFSQFIRQSEHTILWERDTIINIDVPPSAWCMNENEVLPIILTGAHNRANATLVVKACEYLRIEPTNMVLSALNTFPGSGRRFEKLGDNLYTDYGHHPAEIAATLQMAREVSEHVVLVYQPHQNTRQHQVRSHYTSCTELAEKIYWLPTYQTREDPTLPVLTPEELTSTLKNRDSVVIAELNDELWNHIQAERAAGKLVLCMGAGTIDAWLRNMLAL
ncbi:MAG: Mur ligase domain-containing protein [Candidatus Saccharimonas sp.]